MTRRAVSICRTSCQCRLGNNCRSINDDQTSHNIHPLAKVNQEWNKSQPPGSPPIDTKWDKPEFIPVKCNIHPWMHGYFVVLKHLALFGYRRGWHFQISRDLPAGKYTVTAWQEQYGTKTQDVTVGNGGRNCEFRFQRFAVLNELHVSGRCRQSQRGRGVGELKAQ